MGSPQPPTSVPSATFPFTELPLELQLSAISALDSFASLESILKAHPALIPLVRNYDGFVRKSIASTEFDPLPEALLANQVLKLARESSTPVSQSQQMHQQQFPEAPNRPVFEALQYPTQYELNDTTLQELHELNSTIEGLAAMYAEDGMLNRMELQRFKRAMYRDVVFSQLYNENHKILFEGGKLEDDADNTDSHPHNDIKNPRYKARNAYLSRFTHQEVLEIDCVREFITGVVEEIQTMASNAISLCRMPEIQEADCGHFQISPAQGSSDHGEDACSMCEHAQDYSEILHQRGPKWIFKTYRRLKADETAGVTTLTAAMMLPKLETEIYSTDDCINIVPVYTGRDIFSSEVLQFWNSKVPEYQSCSASRGAPVQEKGEETQGAHISADQAAATEEQRPIVGSVPQATSDAGHSLKRLPRGCHHLTDVMTVQMYRAAVRDSGKIFYD